MPSSWTVRNKVSYSNAERTFLDEVQMKPKVFLLFYSFPGNASEDYNEFVEFVNIFTDFSGALAVVINLF